MNKLVSWAGTTLLAISMLFVVVGCGKDEDKCKNVTCQNGGSCLDGTCNCVNGYTGDRCQTAPAAPVASFTIDKTSCTAPCTFNVSSTSTNATSIKWEVEKVGGSAYITINNSTSANATIEFGSNQSGTYKVKLTATNAVGSNTSEKTITVNSPIADPPCVTNNTGDITITITGSTNPYKVFIDGVYKDDIQTPGSKKYTVPAGNRTFKVEQKSGFVFTPTIRETSLIIEQCKDKKWDVNL